MVWTTATVLEGYQRAIHSPDEAKAGQYVSNLDIYVKQVNMVHQSIVLNGIMEDLDPPQQTATNLRSRLFHTYASNEDIIDHFKNWRIMSGYHHPHYPKYVTVEFCQANKMLGLVSLQAEIGIDEQCESGINFCRFCEDMPLTSSSPKQNICKNVTVGAIMDQV